MIQILEWTHETPKAPGLYWYKELKQLEHKKSTSGEVVADVIINISVGCLIDVFESKHGDTPGYMTGKYVTPIKSSFFKLVHLASLTGQWAKFDMPVFGTYEELKQYATNNQMDKR
jgi:hypothetical protein